MKGVTMKRTLAGLIAGFVMLIAASSTLYAAVDCGPKSSDKCCQEGGHLMMPPPMRHAGDPMMDRQEMMPLFLPPFQEIGLDEKNRETVKEIESKFARDGVRKRAEIMVEEMELREALDRDSVDLREIEARLKKLESLRTELRISQIKAIEDIKSKLTPEQRKRFRELLQAGPALRHERACSNQ
jgi:Spy/CpxP family protein refolding chaperone